MAISDSNLIAIEVGHQLDLIRYGSTVGNGVNAHLSAISRKVREVLYQYETLSTIKSRDESIKEISAFMEKELSTYTTYVSAEMSALVGAEVANQYDTLKAAVGKGVKVEKPLISKAKKAINNSYMVLNGESLSVSERIGKYPANQIQAVKDRVIAGWKDGMTTQAIAQSITGTKSVNGVIQTSQRSAYSMAKDLTSHIASEIKADFGKDNDDLIVGEKVLVTLDSSTSPICQDLGSQDDGGKEYYYKKDGHNFPRNPFHYNCRSTMTYILADEYRDIADEGQTRPALIDGEVIQVDAKTNWMDLAKKYPVLAEQSLGPSRAKVLNEMTAKEFTDTAYNRMNQPITLQQMADNSSKARKALD